MPLPLLQDGPTISTLNDQDALHLGTGIYDVTGPAGGVNFMGGLIHTVACF